MTEQWGHFDRRELFDSFIYDPRQRDVENVDGGFIAGSIAPQVDSFEGRLWEKNQQGQGVKVDMDSAAQALADNGDMVPDQVAQSHEYLGVATLQRQQPTLAAIKRDAKRQAQEGRSAENDDMKYMAKRVRIANMTDQDSVLKETRLWTYFCRFCGEWVLITDAGKISRLPRRGADQTMVLEEAKFISKLNVNGAKRKTIVSRSVAVGGAGGGSSGGSAAANNFPFAGPGGGEKPDQGNKNREQHTMCEQQYRFQCKTCGSLVGYRSEPLGETAPATYIFDDTLVDKQTSAMKFVNNISTF
mmetsp:Transcript_4456/g.10904  ORF Transcript_4456/g.10904 Transcript_4456/m.10904 type:complete len:301 (-) Transcript_4456:249-1151(-)|eukprot:CAMPEP_0178988054 /NCGR_PEP_ID=MMETSP0795-20121207/3604_1 /TAXON_ID=88552 /ORGANISM="Amoebophrya sp., Strain Ameob2" /LENGTH=300 /DNA_ID=CAMNT_0020679299 /DNA_START=290 /DNA_END=1192 /DNA_ORIENTATION=+